jgi:hypothetical protein
VCCKEVEEVRARLEEEEVDTCITDHPGFEPVVLNPHVLRAAYWTYRQRYGNMEHPQHRYMDLRRFYTV